MTAYVFAPIAFGTGLAAFDDYWGMADWSAETKRGVQAYPYWQWRQETGGSGHDGSSCTQPG
eukprot:645330-Rhodomonas_salina.3